MINSEDKVRSLAGMNEINTSAVYPNERRIAGRVMTDLRVHYRIPGSVFRWKVGKVLNLSETGLRLSTDRDRFLPHTDIELNLRLPDSDKPTCLRGTVAWVKPYSGNVFKTECGISFNGRRRLPIKGRVVRFLADRLAELASQNRSDVFEVCGPNNVDELKEAFRLLYLEYSERRYCEPNRLGLYYTSHSLLPQTQTFLLKEKSSLVGTVSLIPDSPMGLPMEAIFPKEIKEMRASSAKLAEVSLLALSSEVFKREAFSLTSFRKFKASFCLFKALFDCAQKEKITDLLIAVHPKHELLYRYLQFKVVGPVKSYSGACQKPALPMRLDLESAVRCASRNEGIGLYFLNHSVSRDVSKPSYTLKAQEVSELLAGIRPAGKKIHLDQLGYLIDCYPDLMNHLRRSIKRGSSNED